ncbi:hypothetical protein ACUNV4_17095 [Granulosicoccus sp. 3-233]|uniref:hypothetical protein n=1 Tax=Granulosicoccus sp. 3-233 TaxID=3417969 RepID=UPI003D346269
MIQLSGNSAFTPAPCGKRALVRLSASCLVIASLSLTGCAVSSSNGGHVPAGTATASRPSTITISEKAMFDDLSGIVVQVFEPLSTTLQINRDNDDPRMTHLVDGLASKGFGIQRVSADQGANYLSYALKTDEASDQVQLNIAVGAVELSRDYRKLRGNSITPVSMVRVAGSRSPVVVNDADSRRFKVEDPALSEVQYVASLGLEDTSPIIALITPEIVSNVSRSAADGPSLQALNSSQVEVNNLFYGNESTFASILDDYQRIDKQIIVFGNDSMVLGDTNKQLIEQFVDAKMKDNDVISLVGCSNGPTALDIGNEGLALGRAQRVTQALLARGVARDKVLDEGCWAPTNVGDRFPSRGVVMELWRSNS